jgi:IS4 transposase
VEYDEESKEVLLFLTKHLTLAAATVAAVYKDRWAIELFLRSSNRICWLRRLSGPPRMRCKTQIWTALIAMLLIKYLQLRPRFG